ncbi:hypothetical protein ACFSJM_00530 [Lactococcus formosensis subsp. bovis]|jgi:hypothetical protein|uniref:beta family protein n=1 Tax=Lactococcus TaxID=1357 RepID=UPI001BCDB97B|nr:hypothetical protein [Lactococcus formosensis]
MYVATLRPKQGEVKAIEEIQKQFDVESNFTPNFIISEDYISELTKIQKKYPEHFLIDLRNFEEQEEIDTFIRYRLSNDNLLELSSVVFPLWYNLGIATNTDFVRITPDDIDLDFISWLSSGNDSLPENILIDFGYIYGLPTSATLVAINQVIGLLSNKNIIISSGSVPSPIPVSIDTDYKQLRFEKNLFDYLSSVSDHPLIYGDYCTVHPNQLSFNGSVIIPNVQIKYTSPSEYFFARNGRRTGQFSIVPVCDTLSSLPGFLSDFSWGDSVISEISSSKSNKGNAMTWAAIGINHHIAQCLLENN